MLYMTSWLIYNQGRIDVRILFENASQAQAAELFRKFYPGLPTQEAVKLSKEFASHIPEKRFSMAHLQGYLMGQKNNPIAAADGVHEWVQRHENNGEQEAAYDQDQAVEELGNTGYMSGTSTPIRPSTPTRPATPKRIPFALQVRMADE
jgi:hypothetical protein